MTSIAVVMMVLICGTVWGGFLLLILRAMKHEGRKKSSGEL